MKSIQKPSSHRVWQVACATLLVILFVFANGWAPQLTQASHTTFAPGDVFAAVGNGQPVVAIFVIMQAVVV